MPMYDKGKIVIARRAATGRGVTIAGLTRQLSALYTKAYRLGYSTGRRDERKKARSRS